MHLDLARCDWLWFIAARNVLSVRLRQRFAVTWHDIQLINRSSLKSNKSKFSARKDEKIAFEREMNCDWLRKVGLLTFHTCNSFVSIIRHLICLPLWRAGECESMRMPNKCPRLVCLSRTCVYVFFKINNKNIFPLRLRLQSWSVTGSKLLGKRISVNICSWHGSDNIKRHYWMMKVMEVRCWASVRCATLHMPLNFSRDFFKSLFSCNLWWMVSGKSGVKKDHLKDNKWRNMDAWRCCNHEVRVEEVSAHPRIWDWAEE